MIISIFAQQRIRETSKLIYKKFGRKAMDNFMQEVRNTRRLLETNPYLGPEEPLLANEVTKYRSVVVNHLNKMVYCIADGYIKVADFWDCRRDPKEQASQTIARSAEPQENV